MKSNSTGVDLTMNPFVPKNEKGYQKQKLEKAKTGLRQWQNIHELESYITDVLGIPFGALGVQGKCML